MSDYESRKQEILNKNVKDISDMVNSGYFDPKAIAKGISTDHRTLQQNFTKLCVAWLAELATKNENQYDLRNEASVKLAKEFDEKIENKYLPMI